MMEKNFTRRHYCGFHYLKCHNKVTHWTNNFVLFQFNNPETAIFARSFGWHFRKKCRLNEAWPICQTWTEAWNPVKIYDVIVSGPRYVNDSRGQKGCLERNISK